MPTPQQRRNAWEDFKAWAQQKLGVEGEATLVAPIPLSVPAEEAELVSEQVSLSMYPENIREHATGAIVIGDLHGNAMKLLFFLIKEGILKTTEDNYPALVSCYKGYGQARVQINGIEEAIEEIEEEIKEIKSHPKNEENDIALQQLRKERKDYRKELKKISLALQANIKSFEECMKKVTPNPDATNCFVRIMGDETGDRGCSDYFTLLGLGKLAEGKINFEILISNHGLEFLLCYLSQRNPEEMDYKPSMPDKFITSLLNFTDDMAEARISPQCIDDIEDVMQDVYLPNLKLISYTLSRDQKDIAIFSHAPIDLHTIQSAAKELGVHYEDQTAEQLAETIDCINDAIQKMIKENQVNNLYKAFDTEGSALRAIIWNRSYENLQRLPNEHRKPYRISWGHGHDEADPLRKQKGIYSLDGPLGKGESLNKKGEYLALRLPHHRPRMQKIPVNDALPNPTEHRFGA